MTYTVRIPSRHRPAAERGTIWVRERDLPVKVGDELYLVSAKGAVFAVVSVAYVAAFTDGAPVGRGRRKGERFLRLRVARARVAEPA